MRTICICGGGNLGLVSAGVFLSQGFKVNILTGHPDKWDKNIEVYDIEGKKYTGDLNLVTSNPKDAVSNANVVLLCVPGYLIEKTLVDVKPWLNKDVFVGSIVSSTGFFFFAHKILNSDTALFGFQRVPFISRVLEYGKIGNLLGYKKNIYVALENCNNPEETRLLLESMFLTPVNLLNNFYEASLTNSNPILHTGRLYSMWKDYDGEVYDTPSLFYADWTDEASEILISMDEEFMRLLKVLNINERSIPSLLDYYESSDAKSLTEKLKSIEAFKTIKSPMIKNDVCWIPDFESRYFKEDFPFGLRFIKELSQKYNVPTPVIDKVYDWGMSKIK